MSRLQTIGNRKVAIIGVGFVGASIAYALALKDIAREIVLIDVNKEKAVGEAKDIRHGIPGMGTADVYEGDYSDCADCDLIIVTAGRNRKPGMTRLELAGDNVKITRDVMTSIMHYYTRGVILFIANPVDILVAKACEWTDLPDGTIFGSGCALDTSRFVRTIADYVGLGTGVVNGYVVGEHGDGQVPIWSKTTVGGIPIDEYCKESNIVWDDYIKRRISEHTRTMGAEIIAAKEKTHYGIATCTAHLADAVLNQKPTIAMVCTPLKGEHGVEDVALSVPSVVGPSGVQMRIRERWSQDEYNDFFNSAENVKAVLNKFKDL